MTTPATGLGGSAKTLLAVATAPPLAGDAGQAVAKAPASSRTNDRGEVLGAQRESTGVKVATAPRATVTLAAAGDDGRALWLLILVALFGLAASTPLLLRRRREVAPEGVGGLAWLAVPSLMRSRRTGSPATSNAEHARQSIEAFNRREFDAALADFSPEVEWEAGPDLGPDPKVYRGHAGVLEFWDTWLGTMDDFELEVVECMDAPSDRVFVMARAHGRGTGSGARVEGELHEVLEYEAGTVLRVKLFGSRSDALEAAGLP